MSYRKSTLRYKSKGVVQSATIFINDLDSMDDTVTLLLSTDDDGDIQRVTDRDGVEQYIARQPIKGGAYAFIAVDVMQALKALGLAKQQPESSRVWVRLKLDPLLPSFESMDSWETATV